MERGDPAYEGQREIRKQQVLGSDPSVGSTPSTCSEDLLSERSHAPRADSLAHRDLLAPVDGANFDRLADTLEGQRTRL